MQLNKTLNELFILLFLVTIGMFFLFVHAIMSLVDFSPAKYYWCMYASKDADTMDVVGEVR